MSTTMKHKNITRLEGENRRAVGWWVRIYRTVSGQQSCTSKLFSDSHYHSPQAGLGAAIAWRDRMVKQAPPPAPGGPAPSAKPPGYGTVRRVVSHYRPRPVQGVEQERKYYRAWVAWIRMEDGQCAGTKWSIDRWGEAEARKRTLQWTRRARRELRLRLGTTRLPALDIEPCTDADSAKAEPVTSTRLVRPGALKANDTPRTPRRKAS